jgi:hypothetical protein
MTASTGGPGKQAGQLSASTNSSMPVHHASRGGSAQCAHAWPAPWPGPPWLSVACTWRLMLDSATWSMSIRVRRPTPLRASASAAQEPTPPTPTTTTWAWRMRARGRHAVQALQATEAPVQIGIGRGVRGPSPSSTTRDRNTAAGSAQAREPFLAGLRGFRLRIGLAQFIERLARAAHVLELDLAVGNRQQCLGRTQMVGRSLQQDAEIGDRLLVVARGVLRIAQPEQRRGQVTGLGKRAISSGSRTVQPGSRWRGNWPARCRRRVARRVRPGSRGRRPTP